MASSGKDVDGKLIVRLTGGTAPRFFLISGAGGHVLPFQPMARLLAPRRSCVGVLYPGFFADEPDPQSVEGYAQRMLADIDASGPGDPVLLFGYSLGGLVALEIARILHAHGRPCGLVVVDSLIPHARRLRPRPIRALLRAFGALSFWKNRKSVAARDEGPSEYGGARLAERIKLIGISGERARERYRPGPCPIPTVLIRALERSAQSLRFRTDPELGWGGGLVELLDVIDFRGSHLELFKGHNVESFSAAAEKALGLVEAAARRSGRVVPDRAGS